jgi:4-hydroxybenzoate polyprenyltransferase
MLRYLSGPVKWLIYTNFYIAIAACCFQLVIVVLVDKLAEWNWMLSVLTFFSTWMVYQFSRWNFHRRLRGRDYKRDDLYRWMDRHPRFTLTSVLIGGAVTAISLLYIDKQTIAILAGLGLVSMAYPLRFRFAGRETGLRSIPFIKIFLIASVWAGMSVWVPLSELGYPPFKHIDRFLFHAAFIIFITLPFDIVDISTDRTTGVHTLPAWWGLRLTRAIIIILGLLLITYEWLRMLCAGPFVIDYLAGYVLLIVTLAFYAAVLDEHEEKWKVMAVFDGSLIALFLVTFLLHRYA